MCNINKTGRTRWTSWSPNFANRTQWIRQRQFHLLPRRGDRLHRRRRATNQPAVVLSYRTIGTVNNRYGVKWRNVTYSLCRGGSSGGDVFSPVMAVCTTSFSVTPGIIVIGAVTLKYICGLLFGISAFALPLAWLQLSVFVATALLPLEAKFLCK